MKKLYSLIPLLLITILAFFLRTYRQGVSPRGAMIDESHFGYLAKSILETGKDEHGVAYPLNFKGFGDDKLPLQVYLMVPVVKFFGMNKVTIRYPSIVFGSLLVVVFFYLVRELGLKKKWALVAALLVAISPWSFFLSRFGFESNLALFSFSTSILFLIKALKNQKHKDKYLILAGLLSGLTWYAYIAYRPITVVWPVIVFALAIFYKKITWKKSLLFFVAMIVTILPLFNPKVVANNTTRLKQVGILSDPGLAMEVNENRNFCIQAYPKYLCYLSFNKAVLVFNKLAHRYLDSFSPQFLVTEGSDQTRLFLTSKNYGQFMWPLYLFFILGFLTLITNSLKKKSNLNYQLILLGLLIAPIPAVLVGNPQKVRISVFFPFVLLTIILGFKYFFEKILSFMSKQLTQIIFLAFNFIILVLSIFYFVDYFSVHTLKNEEVYQSYLPEMFTYLAQYDPAETMINLYPFYSDPIMFYAFYNQIDPRFYQENAVLGELEDSGFQHTVQLANVHARSISIQEFACMAAKENRKALYATDKPLDVPIVYQIKTENGVHTLVFIYDVTGVVDQDSCN